MLAETEHNLGLLLIEGLMSSDSGKDVRGYDLEHGDHEGDTYWIARLYYEAGAEPSPAIVRVSYLGPFQAAEAAVREWLRSHAPQTGSVR